MAFLKTLVLFLIFKIGFSSAQRPVGGIEEPDPNFGQDPSGVDPGGPNFVLPVPPGGDPSNDPDDIYFRVFTNSDRRYEFKFLNVGSLDSLNKSNLTTGERLLILADSFQAVTQEISKLKNEYLRKRYRNIILIDWSRLSTSNLPLPFSYARIFQAMKNVDKVGVKASKLIEFLVDSGKIKSPQQVHCIGFSMGAHICGALGQHLAEWSPKVQLGKITGLCPWGHFTPILKKNKLNKKHASYVEMIHTDIDGFGSKEVLGHADFYINGGIGHKIPGCRKLDFLLTIGCAMPASVHFYARTMNSQAYQGCQCKNAYFRDRLLYTPCGNPSNCKVSAVAGFKPETQTSARGKFYVEVDENLSAAPNVFATLSALEKGDLSRLLKLVGHENGHGH